MKKVLIILFLLISYVSRSQYLVGEKLALDGNWLTNAVTGDTLITLEYLKLYYFRQGEDTLVVADSVKLGGVWYSSFASDFSGSIAVNQIAVGTGTDAIGGYSNFTHNGSETVNMPDSFIIGGFVFRINSNDLYIENLSNTVYIISDLIINDVGDNYLTYIDNGYFGIGEVDGNGESFRFIPEGVNNAMQLNVDYVSEGLTALRITGFDTSMLFYAKELDFRTPENGAEFGYDEEKFYVELGSDTLLKLTELETRVYNDLKVDGHTTLGNAASDSVGILGDATIRGNLSVDGRINVEHYEAAAFLHPDSTITTSASTTWAFLGDGADNKFTNLYDEGFSFDGDTLQFNQDVDDLRDSVNFRLQYSCTSAASSVNETVFIGIFVKSTGGDYTEIIQLTKKSRTESLGVYYPGPVCTAMPLWLRDDDKIQIRVKIESGTTTLSTQDFGIYLYEE